MSGFCTKSFSLIAFTLCLCLSFNSVASTFVSAPHNMVSRGLLGDETDGVPGHHKHHGTVVSVGHGSGSVTPDTVVHANSDHHTMPDNCCDDGEDGCLSTKSACATHCAVSVIDRAGFCLPLVMTINFVQEAGFSRSISVNLAGPFKPPR